MMHGQFGLEDVCLSLPCVLGADGIERVNQPAMNDEEIAEFVKSGNSLKEITAGLNI